jgi:hypothetical protein
MSWSHLSRLIAFPLIFVFAAVVAIIGSALTRIQTEFAWTIALALSAALLMFPPMLAVRAISWIGHVRVTIWDGVTATALALAAVPFFAWVFRHCARLVYGVVLTDGYIGFLRFIAFMTVIVGGIETMRLTKRWS